MHVCCLGLDERNICCDGILLQICIIKVVTSRKLGEILDLPLSSRTKLVWHRPYAYGGACGVVSWPRWWKYTSYTLWVWVCDSGCESVTWVWVCDSGCESVTQGVSLSLWMWVCDSGCVSGSRCVSDSGCVSDSRGVYVALGGCRVTRTREEGEAWTWDLALVVRVWVGQYAYGQSELLCYAVVRVLVEERGCHTRMDLMHTRMGSKDGIFCVLWVVLPHLGSSVFLVILTHRNEMSLHFGPYRTLVN